MVKIVAISDLHGHLPKIPKCDLLLIAGDICPMENEDIGFQRQWLYDYFTPWLSGIDARFKIGVAGNHDFVFDSIQNASLTFIPWTLLHNSKIVIGLDDEWPYTESNIWNNKFTIWGSPYCIKFNDHWAFQKTDAELSEIWDTIPDDVDIIMTHTPPYMWGDESPQEIYNEKTRSWDHFQNLGSSSLRNHLIYRDFPNLKLVICGHIHEGRGIYETDKRFKVINASIVDQTMEIVTGSIMELDI